MKVVNVENLSWRKDHPTGSLAFKYLLTGDNAAPDNFVLILARQEGDFATARHRHNFDQFRYPLRGHMNVGKGVRLREGHLGYFTEGAAYGPQDDQLGVTPPGEPMHLTLQFGGATGHGYLSPDKLRSVRDELRKDGEFVDVLYKRHDGKTQGGLEAVWEHAFGRKLEYPAPRYDAPIIMDPDSFPWTPSSESSGVASKRLGTFTERAIWADMVRIDADAKWAAGDSSARRLGFVLSGKGACCGNALSQYSAIQIDAGETAEIACDETTEILIFGLPPIARTAAAA